MIPKIFSRAVEKEIWVLGICADYLEDKGIDGFFLRIIADNHFLLDDSGFCDTIVTTQYFTSNIPNFGFGANFGVINGDGRGGGYGFVNGNGNGNGLGHTRLVSFRAANGFGAGYGNINNGSGNYVGIEFVSKNYEFPITLHDWRRIF